MAFLDVPVVLRYVQVYLGYSIVLLLGKSAKIQENRYLGSAAKLANLLSGVPRPVPGTLV